MPTPVQVIKYLAAGNTDCLSGTDLDPIPYNGVLRVWAGSDVDTATIELPQHAHNPGQTSIIPHTDDNGCPDIRKVPAFFCKATAGQKVVISVAGTVQEAYVIARLSER